MNKRELRKKIDNEVIPDAYDDAEVYMSWYTYFQDNLEFPFKATALIKYRGGNNRIQKVDVLALESDQGKGFFNVSDLYVEVSPENEDYIINIPIRQLDQVTANDETEEAIMLWKFWISD